MQIHFLRVTDLVKTEVLQMIFTMFTYRLQIRLRFQRGNQTAEGLEANVDIKAPFLLSRYVIHSTVLQGNRKSN